MPPSPGEGPGAAAPVAPGGAVTSGDVAWMLLLPAIAVAVPIVVLLAPLIGHALFAAPPFHYWTPELLVRKPTAQAGYVLIVAFALGYAVAVVLAPERYRLPAGRRRALVLGTQVLLVAFLALAWIAQRNVHSADVHRTNFTVATAVVAAAIAASVALLLRHRDRLPALARARALLARPSARAERAACLLLAAALTVVWLLPAVATDRSVGFATFETTFLARFAYDEALSVIDGRSPLVNMVTYASLWPYVTAAPLSAFGGTYAAFSIAMSAITGAALLAVYGVLRRVTRRALAALALYVPFLATSLFIEVLQHTRVGDVRYYPANYFGVFPLRYAGPYLLAWLTVRSIDAAPSKRLRPELLFLAAGLVALNNLDFGLAALGATLAAVACTTRPSTRAELLRLARGVAVGLAGALAAVSLLTLIRAGSLPHLGLLVRYGRVFAIGGFGNDPVPGLGFHLVVTATFVAALGVASARVRARRTNVALTGMLAWSGVFGLGASGYFYLYRSHPFNLIDLFSAWSLALVLLVAMVIRDGWRERRWLSPPELAVVLGFGLLVCSVAQIPRPWSDLRRIGTQLSSQPLRKSQFVAAVASATTRGERVAIIDAIGHRIAREAGVVSVMPYTGLPQMDTREQMDDVVNLLKQEGGTKVFMPASVPTEGLIGQSAMRELRRRGYAIVRRWPGVIELMPARG